MYKAPTLPTCLVFYRIYINFEFSFKLELNARGFSDRGGGGDEVDCEFSVPRQVQPTFREPRQIILGCLPPIQLGVNNLSNTSDPLLSMHYSMSSHGGNNSSFQI